MTWWLIARTTDGVRCWDLGADEVPNDIDNLTAAAGLVVGPGQWLDLSLTLGEPHRTLLARATVEDATALRAVNAKSLAAYRAQREQATRAERLTSARSALAALEPADLATVLSDARAVDVLEQPLIEEA